MAEPKTVKMEKRQCDAIGDMEDDDLADNPSEAIRLAFDVGIRELGYGDGDGGDDPWLAWFTGELGKVFAYLAIGWLAATLAAPVGFRLLAVYLFFASVACFGLERALRTQWTVGERVRGLFGRGEKA